VNTLCFVALLGLALVDAPVVHASDNTRFFRVASTQETRILSLSADGALSFSNSTSNAVCRIEWSPSLVDASWRTSVPLINISVTNHVCTASVPTGPVSADVFFLQGTVVYLDFEQGFYGIVGWYGGYYDPINLPAELATQGKPVALWVRLRPDLVSFHMWGEIVEIVEILCLSLLSGLILSDLVSGLIWRA
jgi:hypothetical protein